MEDVDKFSRRTVKVTREHNEECRRLLGLMGIPLVVVRSSSHGTLELSHIEMIGSVRSGSAMCRACAWWKGGLYSFEVLPRHLTIWILLKVYAAGSEDMDTLTFNAPVLYRHLTFSEARKQPISEIHLDKALEGLEMTMTQASTLRLHHFAFLIKLCVVH